MDNSKLANLANRDDKDQKEKRRPLRSSLNAIIKEFGIKNGSFKVYVRDGRPTERVEIQQQLRQEII